MLLLLCLLLLQSFGLNRAVMLLKGSKSKQVDPWMQELVGPDGAKLHGAGSNRSEDWWKGLGNVLMGQGYLASKTKAVRRALQTLQCMDACKSGCPGSAVSPLALSHSLVCAISLSCSCNFCRALSTQAQLCS